MLKLILQMVVSKWIIKNLVNVGDDIAITSPKSNKTIDLPI